MLDGQIRTLRESLDSNGFSNLPIMAYSAKFASKLYDPFFKEGTQSALTHGDKRTHQMPIGNSDEAMREIALDIEEGADIVMVKPALFYLDVVYRAKAEFNMPLAVYYVSGEFAMFDAAARLGRLDKNAITFEALRCMKRAGADIMITYAAKQAAKYLNSKTISVSDSVPEFELVARAVQFLKRHSRSARKASGPKMEIVLVGLNHRTATVELRERVAFTHAQAREAGDATPFERDYSTKCSSSPLAIAARFTEYRESASFADIERFFASYHQVPLAELNHAFYRHSGIEAVRHIYRVASGLDSMLLGEARKFSARCATPIKWRWSAVPRGGYSIVCSRPRWKWERECEAKRFWVCGRFPWLSPVVQACRANFGRLKRKASLDFRRGSDERASGPAPSLAWPARHAPSKSHCDEHAEESRQKVRRGSDASGKPIQQTLGLARSRRRIGLKSRSLSSLAQMLGSEARHARGSRPLS